MGAAVELTLRAIERRARLYRNTVVAVSALLICSPMAAVALRTWWPLLAVTLIPATVIIFFVLDAREVDEWCSRMRAIQATSTWTLTDFERAARSWRHLPQATLAGMIHTLKRGNADFSSEPTLSGPLR
jgi:hypothetical protein